ncbi:MAG: metallophosphoesterase [Planctomycetes bacterium]|nr:metallophosphoesterase [Planctomycetota bacterium]
MMKRMLLFIVVLVFTLACGNSLLLAQSYNSDSPEPNAVMVVGPYLQAPTESSMTVMWLTDKRCTGWVEYGIDRDNLDRKAVSTRDGMIDAYISTHQVKITGLKPGTQYYYRVMSEEILEFGPYYDKKFSQPLVSDIHTFKTCSRESDSVSVICLNDIHDNRKLLTDLLEMASDKPYDAVFMNGDIMEALYNEAQVVRNVLSPCTELFAQEIPFCYVRGNHETRGPFARHLGDYVDTPGGENFYYAFTSGPVHFIVLDGGEDKVDSHAVYANLNVFDAYRTEQAEWLKKHVETNEFKNAQWRILMSHMPIESTATKHGMRECWEKFTPYLNGKIDLNIAGHTHGFRIVEISEDQSFPIVVGGNNREAGATVIRVNATKTVIDVIVKNHAGETIGTYQVKK